MTSAIAYYRVSTIRQGKSGLGDQGSEGRRPSLGRKREGIEVIGEHVEIETGKGADALDRRPELAAALA